MCAATKLLTAEELLHMPDDGYKYELVDGRLIRMSPPGFDHGVIAVNVGAALKAFVTAHGLGAVAVETGYTLARDPDTVRAPDVSFVRQERIAASGRTRAYWSGPPDLAVEVLSPDDRPKEIASKIREYHRRGVRLVWLIDPGHRTVSVYRPDRAPVTLSEDHEVDGGDVIPGFRYPISKLFE